MLIINTNFSTETINKPIFRLCIKFKLETDFTNTLDLVKFFSAKRCQMTMQTQIHPNRMSIQRQ